MATESAKAEIRAAIDTASHPIVYQGALGEMLRYFYTDERPTLGHYVEHVWMSPDLLAQLAAAIPTYPPQGPQPQR